MPYPCTCRPRGLFPRRPVSRPAHSSVSGFSSKCTHLHRRSRDAADANSWPQHRHQCNRCTAGSNRHQCNRCTAGSNRHQCSTGTNAVDVHTCSRAVRYRIVDVVVSCGCWTNSGEHSCNPLLCAGRRHFGLTIGQRTWMPPVLPAIIEGRTGQGVTCAQGCSCSAEETR